MNHILQLYVVMLGHMRMTEATSRATTQRYMLVMVRVDIRCVRGVTYRRDVGHVEKVSEDKDVFVGDDLLDQRQRPHSLRRLRKDAELLHAVGGRITT